MSNHDLMSLAKSRMMLKHAFFACLLLETPMVEDNTPPWIDEHGRKHEVTAWATPTKIGYNPKFIASLDKEVVLFVLAHEVMHIALKHGLRGQRYENQEIANIAMDFAINIMLKDAGFKIWDQACLDKFCVGLDALGRPIMKAVDFKGMSFEQIYPELMKMLPPPNGGGRAGQGQGGLSDDVRGPEAPMDATERAKMERQIDQRVAQAATAARMCGQMKGDLAQLVDGILNPPLTWQQILQDYATRLVQENENWNHRNRRFDVYLPSKRSNAMGELVVIGDTSGSLTGSPIFKQTEGELTCIREVVKPERVRVIWADDDECNLQQVFEPSDELILTPRGGGGTDLRRPLKFIEQYDPIVCVLITDTYTPWPDQPTPFPLIVLSNTKGIAPDWALTIHI
jgi:predicted metal-dependent peptidase